MGAPHDTTPAQVWRVRVAGISIEGVLRFHPFSHRATSNVSSVVPEDSILGSVADAVATMTLAISVTIYA